MLPGGNDITLYTPTLASVDGLNTGRIGCIESTTAHWRYTSMSSTSHAVGFWDHCILGGWLTFKSMDATFVQTYVRIYGGEERFFTEVWKDMNTNAWRGLLWNFNINGWEEQAYVSSTNTPTHAPAGWTAWETYGLDLANCPALPGIHAGNVQILLSSGQWVDLTPTYSAPLGQVGSCITNGNYKLFTYQQNWEWEVK